MSTKSQKRQAKRYKEGVKQQQEQLKNLTETQVYQLENYAVFQILYVNDIAYNCCKFLEEELKAIPYKTNAVSKIYNALMKRWNAYREFIDLTGIDQNAVANLFCEMDEYMDEKVSKLQEEIQKVLERENVPYAHWISRCETAMTVCDYAVSISKTIIGKIGKISNKMELLIPLIISEPARVVTNMADIVQQIHVKKEIDLNAEISVAAAFRRLNKAFCDPSNFKQAQETADEENIAEGRMTIM